MGKGGGGGAPTQQTVTQTNVPEYLRPYLESLTKRAEAESYRQYTPYRGERIAEFSPTQKGIQQEVLGLETPQQIAQATQGAQQAQGIGLGAAAQGLQQALAYRPGQFESGYQAQGYGPSGFSAAQVSAPSLQQFRMNAAQMDPSFLGQLEKYQMGTPQQVAAERARSSYFTPGAAEAYMSPFQQQVSDVAAREVQRRADIAKSEGAMRSIGRGTFGGSRQALLQAEADRGTQQAIGDIYTRGQQAAFENAQQQFERDQARRMGAQQLNVQSGLQAALANQQAGLTAGQANLQALLGVQQLGTQSTLQAQLANLSNAQQANVQNLASQLQTQGLSAEQALRAALSNQQYGMEAQRLAEQSAQFGATFGETSAARAADMALREQQAREQAAQFGAGLGQQVGLGALQAGTAASQLLGGLGEAQQATDLSRLTAQQAVAAQEQAQRQQAMDLAYADFLRQRDYPLEQLGFFSNIIRGLPQQMGSSQITYQAAPSAASQVAGLGLAGLGLYNLLGK